MKSRFIKMQKFALRVVRTTAQQTNSGIRAATASQLHLLAAACTMLHQGQQL